MSKKDILKEIIARKKQRIEEAKVRLSQEQLKERIGGLTPPRSLMRAISRKGQISLIAEIKKASPSAGIIRERFDHRAIAQAYRAADVQAISVLTEEDYFQGALDYLPDVRVIVDVPLLRKDFIIDPYQIYESRAWGADAVLLIAECLTRETLTLLISTAQELGMECLVEVHTEKELRKILKLKVPLIGINNRDLHSLEVDFRTTELLFPLIPKDRLVVVESGISTHQDVLFLKILGINAVLVGSAFMAADDIRQKVEEVMEW